MKMSDTWTIVWKEWRDAYFPGGKLEYLRPVVFLALQGVIWPLITGPNWLSLSTGMVLLTIFFPFFYILNYVGDAFAGERERHTLETLLASRISDRAILWGKVIATVGYVWGLTLVASLMALVVVNLANAHGPWMFYAPIGHWLGVLLLSMLACLLSTSGGTLVSLHSATARQAQQTLILSSLGLWMVVFFVVRALPAQWFQDMSAAQLLLTAILVMAGIDALLLAIALGSFRRSRLISR
jgi:ABC-2 type transport system permease protein